jgi:hypothetical protein
MFIAIIRVVEIGPPCRFDRILKSTLPLIYRDMARRVRVFGPIARSLNG